VGYFQCEASCPDVRIYADGEEVNVGHDLKFGDGKKTVDVIHVNANGQGIVGVTKSPTIDKFLLRRSSLYQQDSIPIDENTFDCILQFRSGHFRSSMVKKRRFKEVDPKGTVTTTQPVEVGPIAHDVVATYELADGDELQFATNGQVFWTSKSLKNLTGRLDIEILADDGTALRYYLESLGPRNTYWIPNQGQPPPSMDPPPPGGSGK